jgi:hypothetical protein
MIFELLNLEVELHLKLLIINVYLFKYMNDYFYLCLFWVRQLRDLVYYN